MKHCIPFLAVLVLVAAGCGRQSRPEFDPRVAAYYERVQANPQSVDSWLELGKACLDLRDRTEEPDLLPMAEIALVRALELDSTHVPTLIQLARLRLAQRRYEDVIKTAYAAVVRDAGSSPVWGLLGDASLGKGDYAAADSFYYVMDQVDPNVESLRRLARVAAMKGELDEAVSYIDRAINNAPLWQADDQGLAEAWADQGEIFLARGFIDAALDAAEHALQLRPELLAALALKADVLMVKGGAKDVLDRLVHLSPYPRFKSRLARYFAQSGQQARADSLVAVAKAQFESLFERQPVVVARDRVDFMIEWNIDVALALEIVQADTKDNKDIDGYELLARAYDANGDYDRAWSSIALALRKGGGHPRVLYRAAVIARAAGKQDKYDIYAAQAREANPLAEVLYP